MVSSASRRAPVTLKTVAARTGLSVSAVSMALRDHPRIGAETRDLVKQVATELGYVANSAGRALQSRRAEAVALIVPNTGTHVFGHAYFMHILTGLNEVANRRGAHLLISTNLDEGDGALAYDRVLRSGSVDGAIVTSAAVADDNIQRLVGAGLPVVLLGRFPYLPDATSVGIDDIAAARAATEHLIGHGCRNLVHVSGPLDHQSGIDRRDGFLSAVADHGVRGTVLEGDYSEESGVAVVAGDSVSDDVDGVFAANDEMALGAMTTLQGQGRRVPQDVAIIGFDDFGLSRVTNPSISTMHVPAQRMARQATDHLFDLVGRPGTEVRGTHTVLPVQFVPRRSCGCES